ncbi:MAG: DUF4855 domain-containing protein [Planctomycetaceae bacterium]|nr:DUF4855 domain-containing protein [Planctomycetaceae bacterium]
MRFLLTFVCVFALSSCTWAAEEPDYLPLGSEKAAGIVDLVLIYQGNAKRLPWTQEQFRPYLTWTDPETNQEEWLFDGFLFLDLSNGTGTMYAKGYKQKPATKEDWLWHLDRVFERDLAVSALDQELTETIQRLGPPPRKRQIVLMLPEPIIETENWGELDGKPLDFKETPDRIAATKWYVDLLFERWEDGKFQNLELAGFYWLAEEMGKSDQELVQAIGDYVRSKQKRFFWIPWWNSPGSKIWQQLGFDVAYQQPNYFFARSEMPVTRVSDACDFAKSREMGLEMEWDGRLFSDTDNFLPRFVNYFESFEEKGVWARAAIAHYVSAIGMVDFQKSQDPRIKEWYNKYCKVLSQRQKR